MRMHQPIGIGATLAHTVTINGKKLDRPVSYASASLTPAQANYAQIDRKNFLYSNCLGAVRAFCRPSAESARNFPVQFY